MTTPSAAPPCLTSECESSLDKEAKKETSKQEEEGEEFDPIIVQSCAALKRHLVSDPRLTRMWQSLLRVCPSQTSSTPSPPRVAPHPSLSVVDENWIREQKRLLDLKRQNKMCTLAEFTDARAGYDTFLRTGWAKGGIRTDKEREDRFQEIANAEPKVPPQHCHCQDHFWWACEHGVPDLDVVRKTVLDHLPRPEVARHRVLLDVMNTQRNRRHCFFLPVKRGQPLREWWMEVTQPIWDAFDFSEMNTDPPAPLFPFVPMLPYAFGVIVAFIGVTMLMYVVADGPKVHKDIVELYYRVNLLERRWTDTVRGLDEAKKTFETNLAQQKADFEKKLEVNQNELLRRLSVPLPSHHVGHQLQELEVKHNERLVDLEDALKNLTAAGSLSSLLSATTEFNSRVSEHTPLSSWDVLLEMAYDYMKRNGSMMCKMWNLSPGTGQLVSPHVPCTYMGNCTYIDSVGYKFKRDVRYCPSVGPLPVNNTAVVKNVTQAVWDMVNPATPLPKGPVHPVVNNLRALLSNVDEFEGRIGGHTDRLPWDVLTVATEDYLRRNGSFHCLHWDMDDETGKSTVHLGQCYGWESQREMRVRPGAKRDDLSTYDYDYVFVKRYHEAPLPANQTEVDTLKRQFDDLSHNVTSTTASTMDKIQAHSDLLRRIVNRARENEVLDQAQIGILDKRVDELRRAADKIAESGPIEKQTGWNGTNGPLGRDGFNGKTPHVDETARKIRELYHALSTMAGPELFTELVQGPGPEVFEALYKLANETLNDLIKQNKTKFIDGKSAKETTDWDQFEQDFLNAQARVKEHKAMVHETYKKDRTQNYYDAYKAFAAMLAVAAIVWMTVTTLERLCKRKQNRGRNAQPPPSNACVEGVYVFVFAATVVMLIGFPIVLALQYYHDAW